MKLTPLPSPNSSSYFRARWTVGAALAFAGLKLDVNLTLEVGLPLRVAIKPRRLRPVRHQYLFPDLHPPGRRSSGSGVIGDALRYRR